jgi:hypothetical protein
MKKAVLAIILITNAICAIAQKQIIDSVTINATINKSEYIFEGKIIDQCSYKSNGEIYTASFIQLSKTFKGSLQSGIVSVIIQGGQVENELLEVSHTVRYTVGFTGILFCNASPYGYENARCKTETNNLNLTTTNSEHTEIEYFADGFNSLAQGLGCKFNSLQNVYDYIQNETKNTIVDFNQPHITQLYVDESNKPKPVVATKTIDNVAQLKHTSVINDLVYTFSNAKVTGVTTKYFECDVNINADNSNTYFDQGAFRIKFNALAFGINIATATITTMGANFATTTYPTITKINKQANVVSIWVNSASAGQVRTNITTTPQALVHLKIPFINCSELPNFTLDTFANVLAYSTYTTMAASATIEPYGSVNLTAQNSGLTCEPVVNKIYSLSTGLRSVAGGIKEQVKIEGVNFGPNNGKLFMKSADDNGTWLGLQTYDVNTWNDTAIVFSLPSIIDSATLAGGTYITNTPGSGNVGVRNKWSGISDTAFGGNSSTMIGVKYSVSNYSGNTSGYYKAAKILASSNKTDSGYVFYLHTSITAPMRECISAAINKWRCFTGVNFKLALVSTTDTVKSDGKCVIVLSNALPNKAIASTLVYSKICATLTAGRKPFPTGEIDMRIKQTLTPNFFYDTTGTQPVPANKYDFYYIMLHELGHAHGLKHVSNLNDLMYFQHPPVVLATAASKRKINFILDNRSAGDWVMQHSTNLSPYAYATSCIYVVPMAMQDTSCRSIANGLTTPKETSTSCIAYPNPTTGVITLSFSNEDNWNIAIYNLQGTLVSEVRNERLKTLDLNTGEWAKGVYLIQASNGITTINKKIICE